MFFQSIHQKFVKKQEQPLFQHVNLTKGSLDQSGKFQIFENAYIGEDFQRLSNLYEVTLASQSSLDKLDSLSKVSETWSGPISLALFVPDIEFDFAAKYLHYLINCDTILRQSSFTNLNIN